LVDLLEINILKMKRVIILVILIAIISCCSNVADTHKKEFEGIIKYTTKLESKTSRITTDKLQQLYGDTMIVYIKNGNYKMTYNGVDVKDIYYLNNKNNQYTYRKGIDTLFVTDCNKENRKLISSEFRKEKENIINRQCKALINNLGDTKNNYWFDTSIYVNPEHFKSHKFGYVNMYYQKANSPWLKYLYEGKNFNLTHTAVEIREIPLNDKVFELPNLPFGSLE
jgi:PBP1b-binding outer membrane lipoprotein LpoB